MKQLTGWLIMSAVAAIGATGAQAQIPAPYEIDQPALVSDLSGPYAALPPGPVEDYGPRLLPATEVYTVVREGGFSPLGAPQQRGFIYTIAVIGPDGDDGRLVIDARDGHIVRFMPAAWRHDNRDDLTATYGPVGPRPRIIEARRGPPRPPASIPQRYASRSPSSVPIPRHAPHAVVVPADTTAAIASAPVEAKPPGTIEPTLAMPPVQELE